MADNIVLNGIKPCVDPSVDPDLVDGVVRELGNLYETDPFLTSVSPQAAEWRDEKYLTIADVAQTVAWFIGNTVGERIREIIIYNAIPSCDLEVVSAHNHGGSWKIVEGMEGARKLVDTSAPSGTIPEGETVSYVLSANGDVKGELEFNVVDKQTRRIRSNFIISFEKPVWRTATYSVKTTSSNFRDFDVTCLDTWGNQWYLPGWNTGGSTRHNEINSETGFGQNNHAVIAFSLGEEVLTVGELPESRRCAAYERGFYTSMGIGVPPPPNHRKARVWVAMSNRWRTGRVGETLGNLIGSLVYGCSWLFGPNKPTVTPPYHFRSHIPVNGRTYIICSRLNGLPFADMFSENGLHTAAPNFSDPRQQWVVEVEGKAIFSFRNVHTGRWICTTKTSGMVALSAHETDYLTRDYWLGHSDDGRFHVLAIVAPQGNYEPRAVMGIRQNTAMMWTREYDAHAQHVQFTEYFPIVTGKQYSLKNLFSNKAIDAQGGSIGGTPLIQYTYTGAGNQHWTLHKRKHGQNYDIRPVDGPYLRFTGADPDTLVILRSTKQPDDDVESWMFSPSLYGAYSIDYVINPWWTKSLHLPGPTMDDVELRVYAPDAHISQLWHVDPVEEHKREHRQTELDRRIAKAEVDIAEVEEQIRKRGDPDGALAKWLDQNRAQLARMKAEREQVHEHAPTDGNCSIC
ncbi:RICIN domain-containing protein [Glaciimonas immobilis]|uniref:Ricin B lectin domain-containing protein n=1 Tax=Glaciimonas immobilis TaxID=728004 RepID=A0A840RSG2_9BURK|nr:RICIN domain-containing protein [Glaciimonas immobilis]KAF3997827.1 hypothetical protein HAV38_09520 [Glaciimonas immobilis]MBB5199541.1 hypothetical protein [Glaciimonas immobilis]